MPRLFRPEALEGQRQAWLGTIQLIRPVSLTLLTALVLGATVAVSAFLTLGEYTRKARLTGHLVPDRGILRLVAPQPATVVESHAAEGRTVRRGDVLFVLSVDRATAGGDTQAAVRTQLAARERSLHETARQQSQLEREQREALERQIVERRRELGQMDAELDLQRQRLALAREAQARLESLRSAQFISPAQVQSKTEEVLGLQAQLQGLERQRTGQARELGTLLAQQRELPLKLQARHGEIERDLAVLAQEAAESEARRRIVVRAPQDGQLSAVLAEAGHAVTPATPLASLVPADTRLQAQLFAPSSAVGFVRPEQPVLLRYQAYPYQKFGHQTGRVLQVSRTPLQGSELASLGLPGSVEPLYRITVALEQQAVSAYGRAQPLAPGMQLEADVQLDRRRLIEWLFEPVFGLVGRV